MVAVVLLAGVFTMHGLTGNHDVATAMTHRMPATTANGHSATVMAVSTEPVQQTQATSSTAHLSTAENGPAVPMVDSGESLPELTALADDHGHVHSMSDVCLAMLAALLLALIVALTRRSLTAAHPVVLAPATVPVADGPSPPWRRPTLSKLCILRT
ncbi:hypothetical protein GCM10028799_83340 [Kribbella italica]